MEIKHILVILFFARLLSDCGMAQGGAPARNLSIQDSPAAYLAVKDYLVLTPILAGARLDNGFVTIPFTIKNNSDSDIEIVVISHGIDGLAIEDQPGRVRFIENSHNSKELPEKASPFSNGGPTSWIILKSGETSSIAFAGYPMETLGAVAGREIFGVITGRLVNTNKRFRSYSVPFLVPPALTTIPWSDGGIQNYLSITPDLTKVYFIGGNFKLAALELQRADPKYADSIKNGWAEDVSIPFTIENTSNQDLVVAIDRIGCYINGNEKIAYNVKKGGGWYLSKLSTPILKPGESVSGESAWKLSWLEDEGYKEGDKIVAVVGGRIPDTNKIFECCSAPFELPPLPKGEPPIPASK